jgi:hypothetical protein
MICTNKSESNGPNNIVRLGNLVDSFNHATKTPHYHITDI